jgi:hypothetical protein
MNQFALFAVTCVLVAASAAFAFEAYQREARTLDLKPSASQRVIFAPMLR